MWRAKRKEKRKQVTHRSSNKYWKYLYPLLCITVVTVSWTSARYISEIEGVVDSGRTAKMKYEIVGEVYKVKEAYSYKEGSGATEKDEIVAGVTGTQYANNLVEFNFKNAKEIEPGKESDYNIMNSYLINTENKENPVLADASQIKVVFTIKLDSEVTTKFVLGRKIDVTDSDEKYTMIIEGASLEMVGGDDVELIKGSTEVDYRELFSREIPPTNGEVQMKCTVYINYRHDGKYTIQYKGLRLGVDGTTWLPAQWDNPRYMNLYPSIVQVD